MASVRLYRADTGVLLATGNVGDGLRGKSFLDELSGLAMEAACPRGLGAALVGYGREANYPAILTGEQMQSWPIGSPAVVVPTIPGGVLPYAGVTLFRAIQNTVVLGTGTGALATMGSVVPTAAARGSANYGGAGAGDAYVPTPQGCTAAARATTAAAATFNVGAGAGTATFQIIVNGVTYTINCRAVNLAAITLAEVADGINESLGATSGAYAMLTDATTAIRVLTQDEGVWNTLQVVAGATANVIFAASGALGVTVTGAGGPLNHVARQTTGAKPQRRILPQSISVVTTVAANAITSTDAAGVITGNNGLGQTCAGTINYVTGDIVLVYSAAVVNLVPVRATYKALIPVDLASPVRVPADAGLDLAILLN